MMSKRKTNKSKVQPTQNLFIMDTGDAVVYQDFLNRIKGFEHLPSRALTSREKQIENTLYYSFETNIKELDGYINDFKFYTGVKGERVEDLEVIKEEIKQKLDAVRTELTDRFEREFQIINDFYAFLLEKQPILQNILTKGFVSITSKTLTALPTNTPERVEFRKILTQFNADVNTYIPKFNDTIFGEMYKKEHSNKPLENYSTSTIFMTRTNEIIEFLKKLIDRKFD